MPEYRAPGVYVEELGGGPRPIEGVSTATTALVGLVEESDGPVGEPQFCTSFAAFEALYLASLPGDRTCTLATAVRGFFDNGGARLWVLRVADDTEVLDVAALAPLGALEDVNLVAAPGFFDPQSHAALVEHCTARGDRFAVLDMADSGDVKAMRTRIADGGLLPPQVPSGLAAIYAPWVEAEDAVTGERLAVPPSGHICGIYAATDATRGVWKAPAGVAVRGVLGLTHVFTNAEQDLLNPEGVNLLRVMADGITVWGARTLGDPASDYRYVPIRRLMILIEQSLTRGLEWVVFEPNDEPLWRAVRRDVGAFLNTLWRDGALMGAAADEAYFVICDRTTMTQDDLDNGRLVCLIGVAAHRPAEFVMLRIEKAAGG
ncbi:phage tail sheath family protein [Vannielia sp. SX4]|uniref:phage tail sheath family protein n=1 Tax=Vannielia sp. SX4 TaxID=3463852 RepID=UPI0040582C62